VAHDGLQMTTGATLEAPRVPPLVVLLLAVLGISTAAPLVRLSHALPLTIVVWRLGFSLIVIGAVSKSPLQRFIYVFHE